MPWTWYSWQWAWLFDRPWTSWWWAPFSHQVPAYWCPISRRYLWGWTRYCRRGRPELSCYFGFGFWLHTSICRCSWINCDRNRESQLVTVVSRLFSPGMFWTTSSGILSNTRWSTRSYAPESWVFPCPEHLWLSSSWWSCHGPFQKIKVYLNNSSGLSFRLMQE